MQYYHKLADIDFIASPCVITIGMFDGIHQGHINVLKKVVEISKQEGIPSIVFTFSNHPSLYFNQDIQHSTLSSLEDKVKSLELIGIDYLIAVPFDHFMADLTAHQFASNILIDVLQVKHLVFGYDNHFGQNREGSKDFIDLQYPTIMTHRVDETIIDDEVVSSSLVKKYLKAGNVQQVTKLLNHYYALTGIVVKGDQLGRTIGFPTANMQVSDESKLIPANGVYFTRIFVRNSEYFGMTNIGVRPTVSNTLEQRIETHVFNFEQDIYDDVITIEFIQRLRDEKKFDSFPALVEQLHQDQLDAKALLAQIHITS